MIVSSVLSVNMNLVSKINIHSSKLEEGEDYIDGFYIEEVEPDVVKMSLTTEYNDSIRGEDAFYDNERNLKTMASKQIEETIEMYKTLYGSVISLIDKYDPRVINDPDELK